MVCPCASIPDRTIVRNNKIFIQTAETTIVPGKIRGTISPGQSPIAYIASTRCIKTSTKYLRFVLLYAQLVNKAVKAFAFGEVQFLLDADRKSTRLNSSH